MYIIMIVVITVSSLSLKPTDTISLTVYVHIGILMHTYPLVPIYITYILYYVISRDVHITFKQKCGY